MSTPRHPHADDPAEQVIRIDRGTGVSRRQALAAMAASMALANTACSPPPKLQAHPYVDLPEARGSSLPLYYASACVRDGFAHGVLVGTQEGRPIKIEGNAAHPSSLGGTDIYAQASVLQLWDPDRSAVVRQRLARNGDARTPPQLGSSTWSAFEAAWRERAAARAQAPGRATLRVLTGPLTSPTERALIARLVATEPGARWHVHAPLKDAAAEEGSRIACGHAVMPVFHVDQARCILALAADPFSDGPGAVRHAMDWSAARAAARDGAAGRPATLFAAEATPGLFGARADHRVALSPARIEDLLWRVAAHWMPELAPGNASPADPGLAAFEARAVAALRDAGDGALVIGGTGLSAEAHALVWMLNARLGAIGRSMTPIAPPDAAPEAGTLSELVEALQAGSVDTLLVIGANPAYDAPPALDLPAALGRAPLLAHAGLYVDETAALAHWHLPLSHGYEAWGDALAHDGSATLLQPAISPLYDTRSSAELLALLAADPVRDGHSLVQRQWRAGREADFEAFWRTSLRAGVVADSASPAMTIKMAKPPSRPAARAGLTALFVPDAAARDGSFANNGWLQELPRPFTKLTWDNAALLSPATARQLRLGTGDVVHVQVDGRAVQAPVWVSAQQADEVVTLPLGGGRRRAGRVGTGVGFDAFALKPPRAATAPVTLQHTGRRHAFAVTQHEIDQHERELLRTVAPGTALPRPAPHPELYPPFASPVHAWAMVIDLDACIGCNACTIACQAENNIPVVGKAQVAQGRDMHWIRVDRHEIEEIGNSAFQPVPCMHCEQAPCEVVCPVGATVHDSEGLNVQVYNRCVGTRFCSNNCPYKVRRFNFLQYADETTETLKAQRNPDVTVRQRGVMEKCTYCLQRIARARQHSEREGVPLVDGDVVTACQSACPTRAIRFGDRNDARSEVVAARASPRHYAMLDELDTKPRTTYLARVRPAS
jgi:Fe-S-cluster-containing dehydrogenase component